MPLLPSRLSTTQLDAKLMRRVTKDTLKELKLIQEGVPDSARGSDVIKRLLSNHGTIERAPYRLTLARLVKNWKEAVSCGGGAVCFRDKEGNWWDAYFGNDSQSPIREKPDIVMINFENDGKIHAAKDQPTFVLMK